MTVQSNSAPRPTELLYSAAGTRALDKAVIDSGISGFTLMGKAAQAALSVIQQRWPELQAAVIFCGTGNNAGDGYLLAELLQKNNIACTVVAVKTAASPDAQRACQQMLEAGLSVRTWSEFRDSTTGSFDLLVDALLGTGVDRPLTGDYQQAVQWINNSASQVLALDIPSGLHADTGAVMGNAVTADCTVSFIAKKLGLYTGAGRDCAGELVLARLDVADEFYLQVPPLAKLIKPDQLTRSHNSHKASYGRVAVVGGQCGMDGAVLLAGAAALRTGAGLVHVVMQQRSDRGMLELMVCDYDPRNGDAEPPLPIAAMDVIAFGCGLGNSDWAQAIYQWVSQQSVPQIWDADALRILAENPDRMQHRIITPHPGEAAALLGCKTEQIQANRYQAVIDLQKRFDGVVVLKGSGTLVADPGGVWLCDRGNPGMATAGTGDVLTGIIAALLAQGMTPICAAKTGVWLHASAGDKVADNKGEISLVASDIIDCLPCVSKALSR